MVPTPSAVEVDAARPLIGRPVQLVRVPEAGVPSAGAVRVGDVRVLLVRVCVFASNTKVSPAPSDAIAPVVGMFATVPREFFMVLDDIAGAESVGPVARTITPVPVGSLIFPVSSELVAEPKSDNLKLYVAPKAIRPPLIVIFGFSS